MAEWRTAVNSFTATQKGRGTECAVRNRIDTLKEDQRRRKRKIVESDGTLTVHVAYFSAASMFELGQFGSNNNMFQKVFAANCGERVHVTLRYPSPSRRSLLSLPSPRLPCRWRTGGDPAGLIARRLGVLRALYDRSIYGDVMRAEVGDMDVKRIGYRGLSCCLSVCDSRNGYTHVSGVGVDWCGVVVTCEAVQICVSLIVVTRRSLAEVWSVYGRAMVLVICRTSDVIVEIGLSLQRACRLLMLGMHCGGDVGRCVLEFGGRSKIRVLDVSSGGGIPPVKVASPFWVLPDRLDGGYAEVVVCEVSVWRSGDWGVGVIVEFVVGAYSY
nr:hypothetical protein Iba_chr06eCG10010 [Ipomoea batatas]